MPEPSDARVDPRPGEATSRPQLLFFYSKRSGSSRRTEGFLAQVLQRRRNHESFRLHRIEVERHSALARRFRVDEVPVLMVIDQGGVRARIAHPRGCAEISRTLAPWLN